VLAQTASIEPFTEEAASRGLLYPMQGSPQSGYFGFGCGFADLDSDGDPDAVILGAADGHVGLFENDGTGQFIDRSAGSGIPPLPEAAGFAAGDYDGDGLLDLYLTQVGLANVLVVGPRVFVHAALRILTFGEIIPSARWGRCSL
jgi:hypothetical protein